MNKQAKDSLAMALVGDGILSLWRPKRHVRLWQMGPVSCQQIVEFFAERPQLTRLVAVAEIAVGLWLARQSEDEQTTR